MIRMYHVYKPGEMNLGRNQSPEMNYFFGNWIRAWDALCKEVTQINFCSLIRAVLNNTEINYLYSACAKLSDHCSVKFLKIRFYVFENAFRKKLSAFSSDVLFHINDIKKLGSFEKNKCTRSWSFFDVYQSCGNREKL